MSTDAYSQFNQMLRTWSQNLFCKYCQRETVHWLAKPLRNGQVSMSCGNCSQHQTVSVSDDELKNL